MVSSPDIQNGAGLRANYAAALSTDALGRSTAPGKGVVTQAEVTKLVAASKGNCPGHTLMAARDLLGRARAELAMATDQMRSGAPGARADFIRWQVTERNTHELLHKLEAQFASGKAAHHHDHK